MLTTMQCESFFVSLECELLARRRFASQTEAEWRPSATSRGGITPVAVIPASAISRRPTTRLGSSECPAGFDRNRWLESAERAVLYPLPELLLLLLCGTIAGVYDFVELTLWGSEHLAFLRRFLPFGRGIPSHDTLYEVIAVLDPALFKARFTNWVEGLRAAQLEMIAIDGKTSRRNHAGCKGQGPLHTVSAWADAHRLVLGQEAIAAKSNEITAIPLLLQRLELAGALVTIDAIGTKTQIAQTILDRGGDYVLALKQNWPETFAEVETLFAAPAPAVVDSTFQTVDGGHGRIETRRHQVCHDVEWLASDRRYPGMLAFPALAQQTA